METCRFIDKRKKEDIIWGIISLVKNFKLYNFLYTKEDIYSMNIFQLRTIYYYLIDNPKSDDYVIRLY